MNSNKTCKRGGAREGSGRKALNHVYLHIRIPKDVADRIDKTLMELPEREDSVYNDDTKNNSRKEFKT